MERICGAIDVGTSRVKVVAFDSELRPVRLEEWRSPVRRTGLRVEHDPAELVRLVRAAVARLREWGVKCAGVSVYRGSVLAWTRSLRPLTPVVTWMDRRLLCRRRPLLHRLLSHAPYVGKAFQPTTPAAIMRLLVDEVPGLRGAVERGEAFLWTLDAYLAHSLYGRPYADPSTAVLTGLVHPVRLSRMGLVARLYGLEWLEPPEIAWHGEAGALVEGVDVGPVIADQQAASVGLGCAERGCVKASMGTGVFVDASTVEPVIPHGNDLVPVLTMALDASRRWYGVEGYAAGVGSLVDALSALGILDYESLGRARPRPAAVLIPVTGGARTPYAAAADAVLVGAPGSREDAAATVAYWVAALTAYIVRRVAGYAGATSTVLRVGGGLSRSKSILEALASMTGFRVEALPDPLDAARGAALLASYRAGLIGLRDLLSPPLSLEEAVPRETIDAVPWVVEAFKAARPLWKLYLRLQCSLAAGGKV